MDTIAGQDLDEATVSIEWLRDPLNCIAGSDPLLRRNTSERHGAGQGMYLSPRACLSCDILHPVVKLIGGDFQMIPDSMYSLASVLVAAFFLRYTR